MGLAIGEVVAAVIKASSVGIKRRVMGVSTSPGATELAVTSCAAPSSATAFVNVISPAVEAAYRRSIIPPSTARVRVERTGEVHREHTLPRRFVVGRHGRRHRDAGRVHKHVGLPDALHEHAHRGVDRPRVGDVTPDAAAAMIDRRVHHAELISLKGASYRLGLDTREGRRRRGQVRD